TNQGVVGSNPASRARYTKGLALDGLAPCPFCATDQGPGDPTLPGLHRRDRTEALARRLLAQALERGLVQASGFLFGIVPLSGLVAAFVQSAVPVPPAFSAKQQARRARRHPTATWTGGRAAGHEDHQARDRPVP